MAHIIRFPDFLPGNPDLADTPIDPLLRDQLYRPRGIVPAKVVVEVRKLSPKVADSVLKVLGTIEERFRGSPYDDLRVGGLIQADRELLNVLPEGKTLPEARRYMQFNFRGAPSGNIRTTFDRNLIVKRVELTRSALDTHIAGPHRSAVPLSIVTKMSLLKAQDAMGFYNRLRLLGDVGENFLDGTIADFEVLLFIERAHRDAIIQVLGESCSDVIEFLMLDEESLRVAKDVYNAQGRVRFVEEQGLRVKNLQNAAYKK